jgi:uncharacterized protein (DUF2252 family)
VEHESPAGRAARGKALRSEIPRTSHAELELDPARDAVATLERQAASRIAELVPIRYRRMLASPFAFYRGSAAVMAHDLASTPRSGLVVQLCGDAHLGNFGGFASPERELVFDLNDFDETLPGPFEWDVKRLAASFEVAGRERGFGAGDRRAAVLGAVRSYREAMRAFAAMSNLGVWYARPDATALAAELRTSRLASKFERTAARARTRDNLRALAKLTETVDGEPRIVSDPPLVVPIRELFPAASAEEFEARFHTLFQSYRRTLPRDRRRLLEGYRSADVARKVVGVGSVGTRSWILLLLGRDEADPLFLQVKEAERSVLEPVLGHSGFADHGQRVVEGQRLMQASSDIFLGWLRDDADLDGSPRAYYVRQLWDWKTKLDLADADPEALRVYADACGWTLARAHARSGDRIAIAAYLGKGDAFDRALLELSVAYADQNERDFAALGDAVAAGRISAAASA